MCLPRKLAMVCASLYSVSPTIVSPSLPIKSTSPSASPSEMIGAAIVPLLYAGVMSCGIAYTFQIVGQKYTESTVASLLLCMESVFGALSGAVILGERLSGREILGCVVMFAAILLSQLSTALTEKVKR